MRQPVRLRTTTRADGDLRVDGPAAALDVRRRAVVGLPWIWLRQVHGARVVTVGAPDPTAACGTEADALVTDLPGIALAVHTADCAPVVITSAAGPFGIAHAGWQGLQAGVVGATVAALDALGAGPARSARVGPCIHPECYEFGEADLARLEGRWGPGVRGRTSGGRPALDLPAAVAASLAEAGVTDVVVDDRCTACDEDAFFSHRARVESERMATVVWRAAS